MSWILQRGSATGYISARKRFAADCLLVSGVIAALALLLTKPLHQAAGYHHFHDDRLLFGVPNLWNVLSNAPFVIIGAVGLHWLHVAKHGLPTPLRRAYTALMAGTFLTGFCSAYYHWSPSNASLVWDRLPMTIAFAGLFAAMIGERLSLEAAQRLLLPFLAFGIASVFYWQAYDDLRPYVLAQFFPLLTIPLLLWWLPATYARGSDIMLTLGLYVMAKALELADGPIYALGHLISGHTLKHLAAAAGAFALLRMLQRRRLTNKAASADDCNT